jgi:hypothetical protein
MKIRRLIPLALAAYAGWRRLSPTNKAAIKIRVLGRGRVSTATDISL